MKKLMLISLLLLNVFASGSESSISQMIPSQNEMNELLSPFDWYGHLNSFNPNQPFHECLQEHAKAFNELDKNRAGVYCEQWTENVSSNYIIYHYDYKCIDLRVVEIVNKYVAEYKKLHAKMDARALGDGFILGVALALYNKIVNGKNVSMPMANVIGFSPLIMILIQNYKMGKVPYFDIALEKQSDAYANLSVNTFGRLFCAEAATWASFLGTSFMANKIAG